MYFTVVTSLTGSGRGFFLTAWHWSVPEFRHVVVGTHWAVIPGNGRESPDRDELRRSGYQKSTWVALLLWRAHDKRLERTLSGQQPNYWPEVVSGIALTWNDPGRARTETAHPTQDNFQVFSPFSFAAVATLMLFEQDTRFWNHAWSGEQTGQPLDQTGGSYEEPSVGTKPGNPTGEFAFTSRVWHRYEYQDARPQGKHILVITGNQKLFFYWTAVKKKWSWEIRLDTLQNLFCHCG